MVASQVHKGCNTSNSNIDKIIVIIYTTSMELKCIICKSLFHVYPYRIKQYPKYCSSKCYGLGKKGYIPWNKGKAWSDKVKKKLSESHKGKIPWNKYLVSLYCNYCKKLFQPRVCIQKFCSKKCSDNAKIGITTWSKGKKAPWATGEKNFNWKGDDVGYSGLHYWVVSRLGKPTTCWHCGKSNLHGNSIQWANKSHTYKRDVNDWLRLCVKCHRKYDSL